MTVPATDVSGRGWLSRCGCRLLRSLLFARAPRGNASRNLRADRDVLVNLRVVSDAARLAGADGHVCELQLVPTAPYTHAHSLSLLLRPPPTPSRYSPAGDPHPTNKPTFARVRA